MEVTSSAQTLLAPRPTFPLCYPEKKIREMVRRRPLFFAKKGSRHLPYLGTAPNDLGVSLVSSSSRIFKEKGVVVVALIYWRGSALFGGKKKESNELINSRPFPPKKYYALNDLFYCLWAASAFAGKGRSRRGRNLEGRGYVEVGT